MAGCGEYSVTPMFTACYPVKCCDDVSLCYPCLPHYIREPVYKEKKLTPPPPPTRHSSPPRICHSSLPPCHSPETEHCCKTCSQPCCQPVKTKYIIPCYRYEDGRIVRQLPVTAFKRNGMQDQEHSKALGATNFFIQHPRDVMIECDVCTRPVKQNQPTVLTRRACEVALGIRKRAYKPQASFEPKKECTGSVDPPEERKKPDPAPKNKNAKATFHELIPCFPAQCYKCDSCQYGPCSSPPCQTCSSPPCQPYRSPECQYEDCVFAKAVLPPKASCIDCPSYFY